MISKSSNDVNSSSLQVKLLVTPGGNSDVITPFSIKDTVFNKGTLVLLVQLIPMQP